jgi:hypothetical protein
MATYRAIAAASAAVTGLLEESVGTAGFSGDDLELLVHRVRVSAAGPEPRGTALPVDVHAVVRLSNADADTMLGLAGLIMRTLHHHPVLTSELLNGASGEDPVFGTDEVVEILVDQVDDEEMSRMRQGVGAAGSGALLLPYVLRGLRIE